MNKQSDAVVFPLSQCDDGYFAPSGSSSCTACSSGKFLSNITGGTELEACRDVSTDHHCILFLMNLSVCNGMVLSVTNKNMLLSNISFFNYI
jgi:hypothetical protein